MTRDFPELTSAHLLDAKLYATRHDMLRTLPIPRGGVIAEIGVALGDFSKFLIRELHPAVFHGFDLFNLHNEETLWGRKTSDIFQGKTHAQFYKAEMAGAGALRVQVHEGPSQQTLPLLPDGLCDMIYVDAEHTYNEVKADAALAVQKLRPGGTLVFNDYLFYDPFVKAEYGIVPVVNELVANGGWKVIGFALQKHMFCDIALRQV
jgi:hypothetical protein